MLGALVALGLFLVLSESPQLDPLLNAPTFHYWVVSLTSLLAFVLAAVVGFAGARARDSRIVFLAAGFAGLGALFMLHGLTTPGYLVQSYSVTSIAAQLSVITLAFWLFVAAYVRPERMTERGFRLVLAGWLVFLIVVVTAGVLRPDLFRFLPVHESPLRWAATLVVLALLAASGARFLQGYRLTRSALHLVMLYSVGWLAVSQIIMVTGEVFRLSWWIYHVLLLASVVMLLAVVVRQLRARTLTPGLRSLVSDDAEWQLAYSLRPEVRALVVATEAKDRYTAGHMQRVAAYAVRLGRKMGLDPEDLRVLAQAGVVHDVGKIEVPDAVLNKTSALSESEFQLIQRHPEAGARIGRELGMQASELQVIRHHHERWDGTGYPDGLAGDGIPRLARVLAVVDVYDALTSERAYRPAWSAERALRLIREEAGKSLDPECAAAWLQLQESPLPLSEREPRTGPVRGRLRTQDGS